MRTMFVCAALAAVVTPGLARAQTVTLTESQVLAQLDGANPQVQAARSAIDLARVDVLSAARWPNPRVTFSREAVAGVAEQMVMVAQPLPVTGRRRLEVSAGGARVEASAFRAEEQIRRMRADLRLAYGDLWAAQERERELARGRERLNELAGLVGRREEAGEAAGLDRLRAEREVLDVDVTRAIAATERVQAQAVVASFLTTPPEPSAIDAARPDARTAIPAAVDALVARAETSRGDFAALARELEAARFAEQAAARSVIPEPEVVVGTKTSSTGGGDLGGTVSVHVAVPIFDRARPERAAAQARARQVRAEAEALRQTVRAQIASWRAAVIERRTIADRHRAVVGSGADPIERIAQVSYEAGERGILDLLDAYRTSLSARVRQIALDAAVREAEIELDFASGGETP